MHDRESRGPSLFLSPPHLGGLEAEFIQEALAGNYIAPQGPMVTAFEQEFCDCTGIPHAVAVSSGTAALHLALRHLGVGPGDEVIASTLTFIGGVSPIAYLGATPVFIDCDRESWCMDPALLEEELQACASRDRLPRAVVTTDLYGQCADMDRILRACDRFGVPLIADSAESLGAEYCRAVGSAVESARGPASSNSPSGGSAAIAPATTWRAAGFDAQASVYSFNGNKIITTSGGGMLASRDPGLIAHARYLASQARDPVPHYQHAEIGYNYAMSNVLAALGRAQLRALPERVRRKREIFRRYRGRLQSLAGIEFAPEPAFSRPSRWLTAMLVRSRQFGATREQVRVALERHGIESRPMWKPMHTQPAFDVSETPGPSAGPGAVASGGRWPARRRGGAVSEDLFEVGLCLPSGTAMSDGDVDRVCRVVGTCRR